MSSRGVAVTASPSRDISEGLEGDTPEYRMILPTLPRGNISYNTMFLHADPRGRPYRVADFEKAVQRMVKKEDISSFGTYQMNHVWALSSHSCLAKAKFLAEGSLEIKGKKCIVLDPNKAEVEMLLHWLPIHVPDDAVKKALLQFGTTKRIQRQKWRGTFFDRVNTTKGRLRCP